MDKITLFASPRAGEAGERSEPGEGFFNTNCWRFAPTKLPLTRFPCFARKATSPARGEVKRVAAK